MAHQIELGISRAKARRLGEALQAAAPLLGAGPAVGIFYAPGACRLALVRPDGTARDAGGAVVSLDDVFEARVFCERADLRWLNEAQGTGHAVVLTEGTSAPDGFERLPALPCVSCLERRYLLWGQGVDGPPPGAGWSRLAEARIGALDVPIAGAGRGKRVHLLAREYLVERGDHGNVVVAEERLLRLGVGDE